MATTVVSGRVDSLVSERAASIIRAAGLTPAALIKSLWENIAQTGHLPELTPDEQAQQRRRTAYNRFLAFSDALPPCSEEAATATSLDIRKKAAERHA